MTTKIDGTAGVEFPDASKQATAADAGPAFSARRTTSQSLSNGVDAVLLLPTEDFDTANCFNAATGVFQPNVAGYYQINGSARLASDTTTLTKSSLNLMKNGDTNVVCSVDNFTTSDNVKMRNISGLVYLNGGSDYVALVVNIVGGAPVYVWAAAQFPATFSGFLARRAAP